MQSQPDLDEVLQRYGAMTPEQFALLKRDELTPLGQQAYDHEVARRNTPEWLAEDARKDQAYVARLEAEAQALSKIRGWLLLPTISMVVNSIFALVYLASIVTDRLLISRTYTAFGLEFPSDFVDVSAIVFISFEAFTILLTAAFFAKMWFVPRLMVVWLLANVGISVGAAWAASRGGSGYAYDALERAAAMAIVSAVVWVPYFIRSQRVRHAFVGGRIGA